MDIVRPSAEEIARRANRLAPVVEPFAHHAAVKAEMIRERRKLFTEMGYHKVEIDELLEKVLTS